ncbi:MAG: ATP phosphoribosyltransferase [Actinomycetota bacterium]|nr:ATP phosphoribosyltransferase [Actinomycetota bacterium]
MLRLVLPKGSLERATLELFAAADLAVLRSSEVEYRARIEDPRVAGVSILRPQEIPSYVASGLFDLGITGRDWIEETGAEVVSLGRLGYSKMTSLPIKVVLAVAASAPVDDEADLAKLADGRNLRVATEYPALAKRWLADRGIDAEVSYSHGATEAKIPDVADAVVEITETGRALRAAGLKVVATLLESHTELIANPQSAADPVRSHAMSQLKTLLDGALEARGRVLVKLNVASSRLQEVLDQLPSMRSPTISELAGDGGYAVETVVAKADVNTLIPALKDAGASDILELSLSKIVR